MNSKKKIFISLITSFIVVLLIGYSRPKGLFSESKSKHFWLNKFENETRHDVILFGDSRTYRGVSPNYLIGNEKLSGFNYGYTSAGYTNQMFDFLESKLDTSTRPIIVLGITPYSLTPAGLKNKFFQQEINRKAYDKFQKIYIDKKLSFFDRIIIEEILKPKQLSVIQEFNDDGWVSSSRKLEDTLSGLDAYENLFLKNKVSQAAIHDLLVRVKKWTTSGIEVYAFRPPTIISMEELENKKSGFNEKQFIDEFEQNGGKWLSFPSSDYFSYDGSHLDKESALKLSNDLNSQIFNSK